MKKIFIIFIMIFIIVFAGFFIVENRIKAETNTDLLDLKIRAGFDGNRSPEGWIPLSFVVQNKGWESVEGKLNILVENKNVGTRKRRVTEYNIPLNLPQNSKKIFRTSILYKRNFLSPVTVQVKTADKILISRELTVDLLRNYRQNVLVVNKSSTGFNYLKNEGKKRALFYITPQYMPQDWLAYKEIDTLIIGEADLTDLNQQQVDAVINWVKAGNEIIIGGNGTDRTYNSQLVKGLFPYRFTNKRTVNRKGSLTEIWILEDKNGQTILKDGKLPGILIRQLGSGKVTLTAVNPLDFSGKEELYTNLLGGKEDLGKPEYGFLDHFSREMFSSISYNLPNKNILFTVILVYIILLAVIYFYIQGYRMRLSVFISMFLGFILLFSFLFHIFIGSKIIRNNNSLSEIAIIRLMPESKYAVTEGYNYYHYNPLLSDDFVMKREAGLITGLNPDSYNRLGKEFSVKLQGDKVIIGADSDNGWLRGGFRSYYRTVLPIDVSVKRSSEGFNLSVINSSDYIIEHLYFLYKDKWYYQGAVQARSKTSTNFSLDNSSDALRKGQVLFSSENLRRNLSENILNRIKYELTNYGYDPEKNLIMMGIISGKSLVNSVTTEDSGNRLFTGFIYLPLKIDQN